MDDNTNKQQQTQNQGNSFVADYTKSDDSNVTAEQTVEKIDESTVDPEQQTVSPVQAETPDTAPQEQVAQPTPEMAQPDVPAEEQPEPAVTETPAEPAEDTASQEVAVVDASSNDTGEIGSIDVSDIDTGAGAIGEEPLDVDDTFGSLDAQ